jgi:hypothetical protein
VHAQAAQKLRAWKEDRDEPWPGAKESREEHHRQWQESGDARKQARHAAQEAARGKIRAALRDLYISELRARDQQVPPEPLLEADIDLMTGHPLRGFRRIWQSAPDYFRDL